MRKIIMVVLLVLILGALNYSIYEKEQLKKHGSIVFLELAPVDPRSLMQGDYMQLRYALEDNISIDMLKNISKNSKREYIVIRPDENNVAQFVRFHDDDELSEDEKLLYFEMRRIVPDTFLFQEGHAEYYEDAEYGIFKFDKSDDYILIGLADENRNPINP